MKPTIGHIVHYYSADDAQGACPGKTKAAVVTAVGSETIVDLHVMPAREIPYTRVDVPFSDDPKPGHWTWPPRA